MSFHHKELISFNQLSPIFPHNVLYTRTNFMIQHLLIACILLFSSLTLSAQTMQAQRLRANPSAIPKAVQQVFQEQYPDVLVKGWFVTHITYWHNDMSAGWYTDWYGTRTVVVQTYEKPNYFEVEFMGDEGGLSRSIYNKFGYWYETRTQLRGLPLVALEALKATKYAEWKRSPFVEKIDAAGWNNTLYRFKVSRGLKSKIIRMNEHGEIIQERELL